MTDELGSARTERRQALREAEAALLALAKELDRTHPGAADSLREGLHETLTVLRLGVAPTLARTLGRRTASSR